MAMAIAVTVPTAMVAMSVMSAVRSVSIVTAVVVVGALLFMVPLGCNILLLWLRFFLEAAVVVDGFPDNCECYDTSNCCGNRVDIVLASVLRLWRIPIFTRLGHAGGNACDRKSGGNNG